jgi:hypothetical protein
MWLSGRAPTTTKKKKTPNRPTVWVSENFVIFNKNTLLLFHQKPPYYSYQSLGWMTELAI